MTNMGDRARAMGWGRLLALLLGLGFSTACWLDDDGPTAPGSIEEAEPEASGAPPLLQIEELVCRVDLATDSVDCGAPELELPDGASGLIIGGQGKYIELRSENVRYDDATEIFQADVTVRNLLHQAIGTRNWETVAPEGVRVVYQEEPVVTAGVGEIELLDIDGHELFVASEQPYYQYGEMLEPEATSAPRTWTWRVPGTVTAFEFSVFVSAPVPFPNGWIVAKDDWTIASIDEGGYQFQVEAVDAFGRVLDIDEFEWESWDPDVVEISPTGYVTFLRDGAAQFEVRVPEREGIPQVEWALLGIGIVPSELKGPVIRLDSGKGQFIRSFRHPKVTDPHALSIEFWFEADLGDDAGEDDGSAPLLAWLEVAETGPETTSGFTIDVEDGHLVVHVMAASGGPVRIEATGARVERGRWHHVALVFDNGQARLYQDGALVASGAATPIFPPQDHDRFNVAYLGCGEPAQDQDRPCGRYFDGAFDDVRFWRTALDPSVIEGWRKRPVTRHHPDYPSLRGYWLGTSNDATGKSISYTERTRWRMHTTTLGWQPMSWAPRTGRVVSIEPGGHRFTFPDETVQLHAQAVDRFGEPVAVSWSTTDPEVATVDPNGLVTAGTKVGRAGIIATTPDGGADTVWVDWDGVIFVDASATGANDGTSWADAYVDLHDALAAAEPGNEIWVARGTYTPSGTGDRTARFTVPGGVRLYGGFAGHERDPSERRWWENQTILSGDLNGDDQPGFVNRSDNSLRIVYLDIRFPETTALLDGFVLTGANGTGTALRQGGALYVDGGSPVLRNVVFRENWAWSGGAIYVQGGKPTIANALFVDNGAEIGGGVLGSSASSLEATFINATIVGNQAQRGVIVQSTSMGEARIVLENTIVWANTPETSLFDGATAPSLTLRNSIVQAGCPAGANCTAVSAQDPLFWDLAGRDLRLQPGSPAIDAGDASAYPGEAGVHDIGGGSRLHGATIDIGAYERQ